MTGRALVAAAFFTLAAVGAEAPQFPRLTLVSKTHVLLSHLPPLSELEGLGDQLDSGLTTTAIFRVEPMERDQIDGQRIGGATVEVRYELWDRQYLVATMGIGGEVGRSTHPSRAALESWWAQLELPVLELAPRGPTPTHARVTLDFVPFSRSEQLDTQLWLIESVYRAEGTRGNETSRSPDGRSGPVDRILEVLLSTSVRRRATTSASWNVEITVKDSP
jgi:hypothetical protein